jgi:hypothetical protein
MKFRFTALFILLNVVLFTSCEKSNNDDQKTNTELLTASIWLYNDAKIDADNNGTGDFDVPAGYIEDCQKDNTLSFSANGTGVVDEGATKCNTADPQSVPFTWTFTTNETVLNFSAAVFAGAAGDYKIVSLTETELKLSKIFTIPGSPTPLNIIASFKH